MKCLTRAYTQKQMAQSVTGNGWEPPIANKTKAQCCHTFLTTITADCQHARRPCWRAKKAQVLMEPILPMLAGRKSPSVHRRVRPPGPGYSPWEQSASDAFTGHPQPRPALILRSTMPAAPKGLSPPSPGGQEYRIGVSTLLNQLKYEFRLRPLRTPLLEVLHAARCTPHKVRHMERTMVDIVR